MSNNISNITNPNYDFLNAKNFFGINDDPFRLTIIIYIFLSFILNLIIIFALFCYKKNKEFSLSGLLTWNILFVNLFHILFYMLNWVIKNDQIEIPLNKGNKIGRLLIGNPSNFTACKIQAFFLIFLSMSQDIIVNIFFIYINMEEKEKEHLFTIILIFAGYIFPLCITLIFNNFGALGINEKFCYISKYTFKLKDNNNLVEYYNYNDYVIYKLIITIIRGLNFLLTFFFIFRASRYIRRKEKTDKKREKLISSLPIVVITFITLCSDLVYKILSFISDELENNLVNIYLVINCFDSILLPLAFSIKHNIYTYLFCSVNIESDNINNIYNDTSLKDINFDQLLNNEKIEII